VPTERPRIVVPSSVVVPAVRMVMEVHEDVASAAIEMDDQRIQSPTSEV